jgi:twinkle protein
MPNDDVVFVRHVPCPGCHSRDNGSLYSDGHVYCHACGHYAAGEGEKGVSTTRKPRALISDLEIKALTNRKLSEETCKLWGYGVGLVPTTSGEPFRAQLATYYDEKGKPVAQKYRTKDKRFGWVGSPESATLFGQHLWRDGGKMLVITEGEIDAMSVSQAQGNKWPVVSIPNGAQNAAKSIAKNIDWVEQFDKVILMFDQDEPGQDGARECADLLTPGKACIARLPLKDANELLKADRTKEIIDAIWGAKSHRPDGILSPEEIWQRVLARPKTPGLSYPWPCVDELLKGCRLGEIMTIGAGTGTGKSQFTAEVVHHFATKHNERVGVIALEESVEHTALKLAGIQLNKRITLYGCDVPETDLRTAFDDVLGKDRVHLYDHFGSLESENLLRRIRFMVRGLGCTTIVLDHLSIVVSGNDVDTDERRTLDKLMTDLRSLVQQLKFRLICVSHLTRPEGNKGHEQGIEVTLKHFRGSHAISQVSDIVMSLERNQQHPVRKFYTRMRILKNRPIGDLGIAGWLKWVPETGRLEESEAPPTDEQSPGAADTESDF